MKTKISKKLVYNMRLFSFIIYVHQMKIIMNIKLQIIQYQRYFVYSI